MDRNCAFCFKPIPSNKQKTAKYCSISCSRKSWQDAYYGIKKPLLPAVTGTVHQLLVSVDLFKRGYEVFTALNPASKVDLLILDENSNKILRIQATTGSKNPNTKKVQVPYHDSKTYDVLAIVFHDNTIEYRLQEGITLKEYLK